MTEEMWAGIFKSGSGAWHFIERMSYLLGEQMDFYNVAGHGEREYKRLMSDPFLASSIKEQMERIREHGRRTIKAQTGGEIDMNTFFPTWVSVCRLKHSSERTNFVNDTPQIIRGIEDTLNEIPLKEKKVDGRSVYYPDPNKHPFKDDLKMSVSYKI